MPDAFLDLVRRLLVRDVRFVVIGVWGANYYAPSAGAFFETHDRDLYLPPDAANLLRAWEAATDNGLSLWAGGEQLDSVRDISLATIVIERRALVRASDMRGLEVDFTLSMAGFDFETVWRERRTFLVDDVSMPVARLLHIVRSKEKAGRDKDRRFLASHAEALRQILRNDS